MKIGRAGTADNRIVLCFWAVALSCILFFTSISWAGAGSRSAFDNSKGYLLAQAGTTKAGSDDLDFLDEEDQEPVHVADPLRGWNKAMFVFNDKTYFWVLKPLAQGYKAVVPGVARKGVSHFFYNLTMPVRFVNCTLQGKGNAAIGELGRFVLNTTVGVLGFGNPAGKYPYLNPDEEDLGQTFGRYGIGNGIYLVWPIFGPSTVRDTVGMVGDWYLDPVTYASPKLASYGIKSFDKVNETSLHIGDYESLKSAAIDPYAAVRDAYLQHRRQMVGK